MHRARLHTPRNPKVSLANTAPGDSFFQCLLPLPVTLNSAVWGFSCLKENTSTREHNIVNCVSGGHPWTLWGISGVPLWGQAKRVPDWGRKQERDASALGAKEVCEWNLGTTLENLQLAPCPDSFSRAGCPAHGDPCPTQSTE